ncbi:MAG: metal (Ni/Fe) hydrogenase large subunit [Leptospiraceae bacterium]|nr:metal (Ni/Fe) hydrogenase large subunit [Leptospiraceae bacterium]MCK6380657.1 metal (Ni/Fe) hydrogenase large subunit [Leptospiraceae bacterium]NUM41529.1 metal (Ni/Fe) hydrogenase large subunit [Leptospiraceae bacterium]
MPDKTNYNCITGFFQNARDKKNYIFHQNEKTIFLEKSEETTLSNILNNIKFPIWLIRHSIGIPGKEEILTGSLHGKTQKSEREEELENCILPSGQIRDLVYRGIKVPVSDRGYSHAVGPIHAGVIEPGHFRFSVEGSVVHSLNIRLGFQKRNIPELIKGKEPIEVMPFSEAISGDSTIAYSTAFCEIYENALGIEVADNVKLIRSILLEIERVAMHIGDIGAMAGDIGYYPLLGVCSTDRGVPLGVMERLTGSRFGRGVLYPGEVRLARNLTKDALGDLVKRLQEVFIRVEKHFLRATRSSTIRERLQGCGVVSKIQVHRNSFVGMTARCTGANQDMRFSNPIYGMFSKPIAIEIEDKNLRGDAWSRFYLRYIELKNSVEWLRNSIPQIQLSDRTSGEFSVQKYKQAKPDVYFSSVEGWRGPVLVALDIDSHGKILSSYIRDPSVLNWRALELAIQGELVMDFPLNNKSFNLSYVGVDL